MEKALEFCNDRKVEYREEGNLLIGYGAVFFRDGEPGTEFNPFREWRERIVPGAFGASIERNDNVRALFNHDANQVLGNSRSGTMRLSQDRVGLRYEIDLPDTSLGKDVRELVRRGDVTGSSFAFTVDDEELIRDDVGTIREIRSVTLYDTGPVTYPAYEATSVSARSISLLRVRFEAIQAEMKAKEKGEKPPQEPEEEEAPWDQRKHTFDAYQLTLEPRSLIIPRRGQS